MKSSDGYVRIGLLLGLALLITRSGWAQAAEDSLLSYDLTEIVAVRFGVTYHPGSLSRVVRRLGFSHQKPRPYHPDKDEAAQAAFRGAR